MCRALLILVVGLTTLVSSIAVGCGGREPAPRPVESQDGSASSPSRGAGEGDSRRGDRDDRGGDGRDARAKQDDRDDREDDRDDRDDRDDGGDDDRDDREDDRDDRDDQ